jgi:hypothetical protein
MVDDDDNNHNNSHEGLELDPMLTPKSLKNYF